MGKSTVGGKYPKFTVSTASLVPFASYVNLYRPIFSALILPSKTSTFSPSGFLTLFSLTVYPDINSPPSFTTSNTGTSYNPTYAFNGSSGTLIFNPETLHAVSENNDSTNSKLANKTNLAFVFI